MKKICAWCRKDLGVDHSQGKNNAPISHGICPDCYRKLISFKAKSMRDFLNQFSHPVLLVDSEVKIISANKEGLAVSGKKIEEIEGALVGDVFDCKYSSLPGGCGKTTHCKGCTIRNTVRDTFKSGVSQVKVAAYQDLHHETGEHKVKFLISTEKTGDKIFLRIDEISEQNSSNDLIGSL